MNLFNAAENSYLRGREVRRATNQARKFRKGTKIYLVRRCVAAWSRGGEERKYQVYTVTTCGRAIQSGHRRDEDLGWLILHAEEWSVGSPPAGSTPMFEGEK